MSISIKTRPAGYPVTVNEAKRHCVIAEEDDHYDTHISAIWIPAAVGFVEQHLQRDLVERVYDYYLGGFPGGSENIVLPKAPVISIVGIDYQDVTASPNTVSVASTVYGVDTGVDPGEIYLEYGQTWPTASNVHNAVHIEFKSGYATQGSPTVYAQYMPEEIKAAILMLIGDLYDNREAQQPVALHENKAVMALLQPHRLMEL